MAWRYAYSLEIWPAVTSAALTVVLGLYSWFRRNVSGAGAFAIGCLFAMLWAIGSSLETAALDFSTKVFWVRFSALWQIPMVTAVTCFFLEYAEFGRFHSRRIVALMSVPELLVVGLMLSNDYHHLIWTSFSLNELTGNVMPQHGIATWLSIVYANLLGIINVYALLRLAIRSPKSRWPVMFMVLGLVIGRIMYVIDSLYAKFMSPSESVLVVVGLSCSLYSFALFHFQVLNPIPLARSIVIEQMSDGMIVLDLQGRIIDLNPAATEIFGTPASVLCGQSVLAIMPEDFGIEVQPSRMRLSKPEISLGSGDAVRYFSLGLTHLSDRRGEILGHLLLLHEITGQRRSQELLMEKQRVYATLQERERLAHELHDSIGQVLGYISLQAQAARKWAADGNIGKTLPILSQLAEIAQEAHADVRESIFSLRTDMIHDWEFLQSLRKYLDHYQASYGIGTELLLPEALETFDLNPEAGVHVMRVIQEAMTNARRHGGARHVTVEFAPGNGRVFIRISDDGSGFDPAEMDPEAGKHSGKHFGLMFMRERMAQIGGAVTIESRPGSGTAILLDVISGT